ncbi:MAG TPA: DUF87 domain-containing protein [Anaerolineales bacterium]|nr:DUF87 domain-containing protein [Anaerolineales bacterium]
MDTPGQFYLGRMVDPATGKAGSEPLIYDSEDLTTHGVVVGMTGSGKTGLCIGMLEEAALNHIPALMIDPKGDITNALLHFPNLSPQDFQPWVNPDQARREGKTLAQAAEETAANWRKGLEDWGIGPERLQKLADSAHFAIYTPGSDSGIPVSILASLKAPVIPWDSNREMLREQISSTVTALLGLVGLKDIDPVRSREHILLSNIFEYAWSHGHDLDLSELILQAQTPPFQKLGVFDVNTFFPEKDRFQLAMLLNNILAAPAFQSWIEGQPLDVQELLYHPDGKPRHSVFYIAHLSDEERMFFVTLLYSAVETWMRSQTGTGQLRAIVYFDEIFGYLPPVANPASKQVMLRMLKQARAFGVGQVLVTQNPVDVDYKALSNAGSWFIGKLQTDQDKQRLLDGLSSAAGAGMDRAQYDHLISGLGKRVFLLHNIHNKQPVLFSTRWAMNYLAGPLTRSQIPPLNAMVGATAPAASTPETPQQAATLTTNSKPPAARPAAATVTPASMVTGANRLGSLTRPGVPAGYQEYFLPNNVTLSQAFQASGRSYPENFASQGLIYKPVLLAQAGVRFFNRKYNLDTELNHTALVTDPDRRGVVRWEDYSADPIAPSALERQPAPESLYASLEAPLSDAKLLKVLEADFTEWAFRSSQVTVRVNENLNVYAGPEVSPADFRALCAEAARAGRDAELKKLSDQYDRKLTTLKDKLTRESRELDQDEDELSSRKMEELGTHADTIFSLFGKRSSRRKVSSSMTKRRLTSQAKADVTESKEVIADLTQQISALEAEKNRAVQEVNDHWAELVNRVGEIPVSPMKKDVLVSLFGIAWLPYHLVEAGSERFELPGYRVSAG